jgi:hypothetical protein
VNIANELTDYFREGYEAARVGVDRCPHYATSDAAAGWHAGNRYADAGGPLNAGEIILATKGTGDRVHLFGGRSLAFGHWIASIGWNHDDEHAAAVSIGKASAMSSMSRRYKAEILRRQAPSPCSERERLELELRAAAPLQSKGRPVADADHLPLFVAANEPTLF